jgi:hypothetical protein
VGLQLDPHNVEALVALGVMDINTTEGKIQWNQNLVKCFEVHHHWDSTLCDQSCLCLLQWMLYTKAWKR